MICKLVDHISISRQCELLGISRSAYYYDSVKDYDEDNLLKRKIDEKYPFYGSRRILGELKALGRDTGRYKARRLMREMGIEVIYQLL